jgi:hypothetical protein
MSKSWELHERIYEARRVMNNLTTELEALEGVQKSGPAEDVLDTWAAEIQRELDALPVNCGLLIIKLRDAGQALWDINMASREIRRLRGLLCRPEQR